MTAILRRLRLSAPITSSAVMAFFLRHALAAKWYYEAAAATMRTCDPLMISCSRLGGMYSCRSSLI